MSSHLVEGDEEEEGEATFEMAFEGGIPSRVTSVRCICTVEAGSRGAVGVRAGNAAAATPPAAQMPWKAAQLNSAGRDEPRLTSEPKHL